MWMSQICHLCRIVILKFKDLQGDIYARIWKEKSEGRLLYLNYSLKTEQASKQTPAATAKTTSVWHIHS